MPISASELLEAIKGKTLKANASLSTSGDRVSIELRADGKAFAVLDCLRTQRARATFGRTVHVLPSPGSDDGFAIECGSEVEAMRVAMELDNCLNLAFAEALGVDQADLSIPSLGLLLTLSREN